jgi:hypothetical protein
MRMYSYLNFNISCENSVGLFQQVIEIEASADIQIKLSMSDDLLAKIRIKQFDLQYERIP